MSLSLAHQFWRGLACMSSGAGLRADWQWACGAALDLVAPYLQPTAEQECSYPCRGRPGCQCRHAIRPAGQGWVAVCTCGPGQCPPFVVEPKDTLVHRLDTELLAHRLRQALAMEPVRSAAWHGAALEQIGCYGPLPAPVYLSLARADALLRDLERLWGQRDEPLVLLTPTGSACTAEVECALRRQGAAHLSLSSALEPLAGGGGFTLLAPLEPVLAGWVERSLALRDPARTLRDIHREIAAVRATCGELHQAKRRLEQMLAEGWFAFVRQVDAASFKIFCTILAEGDTSKAARSLGVADSTLRDRLRGWHGRSPAYRSMLDLVRWRKSVRGNQHLPLNDLVRHETASPADYPGLLSDVLDGLLEMNAGNWEQRCAELADLLRTVPRG